MEKIVKKIKVKQVLSAKKKVCAYARVSSGKDTMLHSLSYQVSYYSKLIQENNNWLYVGVYADEAMSGTKTDRSEFQKMIEDANAGKIDMIITKSISRFARNTVTLLEVVRKLREKNIDVYFEEQKIHSISKDGELMLSILASYAQEEARSVSENMKWRIKKNFQEGKPWGLKILGYKYINDKVTIIPHEAETVRLIFNLYLSGKGTDWIAEYLNQNGVETRNGKHWVKTAIQVILRNYTYTGNLVLQKTYRKDYISKKVKVNNGEYAKYLIEENHEPIIDLDTFNKVQEEIARRSAYTVPITNTYPLTGILECSCCGSSYKRRINNKIHCWTCRRFVTLGKKGCQSKSVHEDSIYKAINEILETEEFNEELFKSRIEKIIVKDNNCLLFKLYDGNEVEKTWQLKSRKESWTPEMKEKARIRAMIQNGKEVNLNGKSSQSYTINN